MEICQDGLPIDKGLPEKNKPIWNMKDLMNITGLKKQTIYNRIGEIPHRKKGGRLYFFPDEIISWIDEGDLE